MTFEVSQSQYKLHKYRARDLTERQILFCELYLADGLAGRAARQAGYKSPTKSANHLLKCKRILKYLNMRQKQVVSMSMTFEYKMSKLATIIDRTIPEETDNSDKIVKTDYKTGITAIAEANKMSGHYAPTQVQEVTVQASIDDIRNANASYKKEY